MGDSAAPTANCSTDLNVEAELLEAFEQSFFVAGHEGLQVGVDGRAHLGGLLLNLQLDADGHRQTAISTLLLERWAVNTS